MNGNVIERFYEFADIRENRSAAAISSYVIDLITKLKIESKFIGQGYDGAAVMSGQLGGVQALVRNKFPAAKFIHCNAHVLNLVLSKTVEFIREVKIFFNTLSSVSTFFAHLTKRKYVLNEFVKRRIPTVSATRWNVSLTIVNTANDYKNELKQFFELIINSED